MNRYYHFFKPTGCVSARRDAEHKTVMDYFPPEDRDTLFPLGRLDKNTEGLLLVTDDGKLNHRLLDPANHVEKTYLLWAAGTLGEGEMEQLRTGVHLKGLPEPTKPARVEILAEATLGAIPVALFENRRCLLEDDPEQPAFCLELTITEGKRHQIKRMLEAVGCTVVYLRRTHFAGIALDEGLRPGDYRPLTEEELALLLKNCPEKGSIHCKF